MLIENPTWWKRLSYRWNSYRGVSTALVLASCMLLAGCGENLEFTRRPIEQAQSSSHPSVYAPVFVVARSDAASLKSEIAALLPKRLLRVSRWIRKAACVEKNGRKRCASAQVRGDIVRTGKVKLAGSATGFALEIPVSYDFAIKGGGVARSVKSKATGSFIVRAPFAVSLDGTWQPDVRFAGDLVMEGAEAIPVLDKTMSVARPLARNLRRPFARLARAFRKSFDTTEATKIVEKSWRHLHYPVRLREEPPLWLRGDPESVAYGGVGIRGDDIELRIAILGKITTFAGERPVPLIARSMPELDEAPARVASTHLILPIDLPYSELVGRIRSALDASVPLFASRSARIREFAVKSVALFPSNGRLTMAIGLDLGIEGSWQKLSGTAYLIGTPVAQKGSSVVGLKLTGFTPPTSDPALYDEGRFILPEKQLAAAFRNGIAIDLKDRLTSVREDINRIASVGFAKDDTIHGQFDDVAIHSIETLERGLRINLDLVGALSVYPGTGKIAAGPATVEPSSSSQ